MHRLGPLLLATLLLTGPVAARHDVAICGTTRESGGEGLFLHRQALRSRVARRVAAAPATPSANRDIGNIAIIEDTDGVVERLNQFNLDTSSVTFTPGASDASHYRYAVSSQGYDADAASQGSPLAALDDDDTRQVSLPFAFPFFGSVYNQVFVNSDGNLTFGAGDNASSDRSLGRMTAGPPRISPSFDDLDPSKTAGGVRVFADATRVVVSWVSVPEWQAAGIGARQTFQVKLYPDGRIQFSYSGANPMTAVVGIAPGNLKGATSLVSFRGDASADYPAAVAERFSNTLAIDVATVAQKFYQTHEDAYDYLVIYNTMDVPAMPSAVAYESTVRSSGTGYGVAAQDAGQQYGSPSRLRSLMNMGNLGQYPVSPNGIVSARQAAGDTPITVLAHEAGHLFLAFASIRDASDPSLKPMLGFGGVHWSFVYNSEASLLEGERIVDHGAGVSPRFQTTDTVQGYAPMDQYLMGFRAAQDVPGTFVVTGYPPTVSPLLHPVRNIFFDGARQDISVNDIILAEGRRTPDYTVAQRRFRFAFILIVPQGAQPTASDLSQIDNYRQQFEPFYTQASSSNAIADTTLKRSLKLSLFPAAGVVAGGTGTAALTVQSPPAADMTVQLQARGGNAQFPASVVIPAGATNASFTFTGLKAGVEEVLATPGDVYETAAARVQVADAALLKLTATSNLPGPVVVQLADGNNLPYPGARITATASPGGTVSPAAASTDAKGQAAFQWSPGSAPSNQLRLSVVDAPAINLTLNAGSGVPAATAVVNAASFVSGMAPGAIETVFGVNLAGGQTASAAYPWPATLGGVRLLLNGSALPIQYVSDTQINFYVPPDAPQGTAALTVVTPSGAQAGASVAVTPVQPGIFPDAVLHAGTAIRASATPVHAGDYIEIYCTGLGATKTVNGLQQTVSTPVVFLGATPVTPVFSGLTPAFAGLYQVNVQVPGGLAPGLQPLTMSVNLSHSNEIQIAVQ